MMCLGMWKHDDGARPGTWEVGGEQAQVPGWGGRTGMGQEWNKKRSRIDITSHWKETIFGSDTGGFLLIGRDGRLGWAVSVCEWTR